MKERKSVEMKEREYNSKNRGKKASFLTLRNSFRQRNLKSRSIDYFFYILLELILGRYSALIDFVDRSFKITGKPHRPRNTHLTDPISATAYKDICHCSHKGEP